MKFIATAKGFVKEASTFFNKAGHTVYSDNKPEVIIGERYGFAGYGRYLLTSTVQEIVSETETETIFKTTNSTYKLITNS